MKPFNLEEAKAGKPLVTRDGRAVTDFAHFDSCMDDERTFAVVDGQLLSYYQGGLYMQDDESSRDLFMAPEKSTVYMNVYAVNMKNRNAFESCAFKVEADAKRDAEINGARLLAVAVPVEIEE